MLAQKYQQAQYLQQNGQLNDAKRLYLELLELIPAHPDSLHYLGLIYFQQGNLEEADKLFKKSIELNNNPVYLTNYALLAHHQKDYQKTIQLLKEAIALKPTYAGAWFNLGCTFSEMGDMKSAEDAYLHTIKIDNTNIKALFNLVSIQESLNKSDEVKLTINKLISTKPSSKDHYYTLGLALSRLKGNEYTSKAIEYFKKALAENPKSIEAYRALASMYMECNSTEKAYELYEKINVNQLDYRDLSLEYANCLTQVNEISKAEVIYKEILKKEKNNSSALNGIATIYRLNGKFKEAEILYRQIIETDKANYKAYYGFSQCKKFTANNESVFEKLKNEIKIKPNTLGYFALAKINDDLGDYSKATTYYRKANERRDKKIDFRKIEYSNKIKTIRGVFNVEYKKKIKFHGHTSELPIFILGAPRSGTTLIEQIIASHPKIYGAGELSFIKQIAYEKDITENQRESFPKKVLTFSNLHRDAEIYLSKINSILDNQNILRVTDKMPSNFIYLGYILSMFPNAKIIHLERHPVDTCLSIYFQNFTSAHEYSFNLDNLVFFYHEYFNLMKYWKGLYGDKILTIQYNDIVNNTENTAKSIINYCNLDWDTNCLKHHKTERVIHTSSQWQARQPIYKSSQDRWKNYEAYFPELADGLSGLE